MKSIGGYLELELKKNEEYHKEALLTQNFISHISLVMFCYNLF